MNNYLFPNCEDNPEVKEEMRKALEEKDWGTYMVHPNNHEMLKYFFKIENKIEDKQLKCDLFSSY